MLVFPLIHVKTHDQYEASLYMEPFMKSHPRLTLEAPLVRSVSESDNTSTQLNEDDLDSLLHKVRQHNFEDPHLKKKVDQMEHDIWESKQPTQTR